MSIIVQDYQIPALRKLPEQIALSRVWPADKQQQFVVCYGKIFDSTLK
tara:strand:- start:49 stop:192 length:144 start_codon:yes stop_codon:yes gene_type:complete